MKNLNKYEAVIDTRVGGIPCLIGVVSYERVKGDGYWAISSDDSRDGFETEWELLDRRGYVANWLERKTVAEKIEEIIYNYFEE